MMGQEPFFGQGTTLVTVLFLGGIQLISLGIIGLLVLSSVLGVIQLSAAVPQPTRGWPSSVVRPARTTPFPPR